VGPRKEEQRVRSGVSRKPKTLNSRNCNIPVQKKMKNWKEGRKEGRDRKNRT